MEKQYKDEDQLIKQLINEAGLEKPSGAFSKNVMSAIQRRSVPMPEYVPLISAKAWRALAALTFVVICILILVPFEGVSVLQKYAHIDRISLSYTFPTFKVSNSMLYGIIFTALFLVEIPFLKRFIK